MAVRKRARYNGQLSFGGAVFNVNITKFSYSYVLTNKGTSQARQSYTLYPNRVEQSELSVELIFRTPQEYRRFADFVKSYHIGVTSSSSPDMLRLKSSAIRGGIDYGVAIKSAPFSFDNKMVAPTMRLSLVILKDMLDSVGTSSDFSGGMTDLATEPVSPSDVKNDGDDAFTGNRFMR